MKDLKDFILVYDKVLPEDACKTSVQDLENRTWEKHLFYESKTNTYSETIDDCDMFSEQIVTGQFIAQAVGAVLHDYVKKLNSNYFNELQKFSQITYHRYRDGKQMIEHCDHIHALFKGSEDKGIPILSVVGVLNDEYAGGEFIMFDDYEIKLGAGDIIVFPSVFLYPHRINKVTQGTRYSFVSWAW